LGSELAHAKDILQRQTIEKEQMNQQLNSLQINHAEENKIEFKNLQNALDSSKKELEAQRMIVNDYKMKIEDLSKQVVENKQLTQKSGDSFLVSVFLIRH
jgi:chromosome segregation ATPase